MKKNVLVIAFSLLTGLCSFAQTDRQTKDNPYLDGEVYIKLKNEIPINTSLKENYLNIDASSLPFVARLSNTYGITKITRPFASATDSKILPRIYRISFSNIKNADGFISDLKKSNQLDYVEKVPVRKNSSTPNDPYYSSQWDLAKINAAGAWNYSTGSSAITVAVIDDAVDINHPDLSPNVWTNPGEIAGNGIDDDHNGYIDDIHGWNVVTNNNDPTPPDASYLHGTHVAGVVSAKTNNSAGVASIGYGVSIIAIRAGSTATTVNYYESGIYYAIAAKARVINMSFGGSAFSQTEQNLMTYAHNKGIILIAAAGNSNGVVGYPAADTNVVAVAATASDDTKSSYSNYGAKVEISAPGDNIYSTDVNNTYGTLSGTSFASPMVAGLCGLMLSLNPYLTPTDVVTCLKSNADNIDGINPGYAGQLGAGRINANNTMACVQASLAWKPTPYFHANYTSLTAGGSVTFADSSIHHPTTWTWSFTGGTPSSYSGQNPPPIKYSTAGTYNVSLTVSNLNGSNALTKSSYIVVTAPGACEVENFSNTQGTTPAWTPSIYGANTTGSGPVNLQGYVVGLNGDDGDKQKAQYFDNSATPQTYLTGVVFYFYKSYSSNMNKTLTFNIYDGTSGTPGTLLGTSSATLSSIHKITPGSGFQVNFAAITMPSSQKIFIGIDYSNLDWTTSHDTLALISNANGQTSPSGIWEQKIAGTWAQDGGGGGFWNFNGSMYVFPLLTNNPTIATITSGPTTICQGGSVSLNAAGSTHQDTLVWYVPGASPVISNNLSDNFIFNTTAGTYTAKLYVVGGGCHQLDSAATTITVNANPTLSLTSSAGATICAGSSTNLSATGATTYTWSPSTGLSATSGANVTANPSNTTNYTISGTLGSCTSNASFTINVDPPMVKNVVTTPSVTTLCAGGKITFDASLSTNVSTFSWSFPGGTPSTSNAASPVVTYSTQGTYTASLTIANSCFTDATYSQAVTVNICTGIDELYGAQNVNSYFNSLTGELNLTVYNSFGKHEALTLGVYNALGESIYAGQMQLTGDNTQTILNLANLSSGIYTLRLMGTDGVYSKKFLK